SLQQAERLLGDGGPQHLNERLERARRDLRLVVRLDEIRLRKLVKVEGQHDPFAEADREDLAVFEEEVAHPREGAESVGERSRASEVRGQLLAAVDDWAGTTNDEMRRRWLLEVGRLSDDAPGRGRFRDPAAWADGEALRRLTKEAVADGLSSHL